MRGGLGILFLAAVPWTSAQQGLPSRAELAAVEKSLDGGFRSLRVEAPMELLGLTRGVYLRGYGAVFTAEVNLLVAAGISPFRPTISKEEVVRVREAKKKRLPELRNLMQQLLLDSASGLDRVPETEQIVLGVSLFYQGWEDRSGLPSLILMQAPRRALLDIAANRMPRAALPATIQVREE